MSLLVVNDDGIESPALVPLLHALSKLGTVRAVVPAEERSWIGKAITRNDEIVVERVEREGFEILTTSGFPADCTQLGVHSLFDDKPEMVISGINIGYNHGLAFLLSSGTVGAAAEGWIAGLPAIAFSAGDVRDHRAWAEQAWQAAWRPHWERLAALVVDVVTGVREHGYPPDVDLLSVNFPHTADRDTPRRVTSLARVGYDRLFATRGTDRFAHDFVSDFFRGGVPEGSDLHAAEDGVVSITPLRLAHAVEIDPGSRARLARPGVAR